VDGREYRFMSEAEFDRLIEADAFLEHASMFGHRSGTLLEPVERARGEGHDVLLEIDVQGARQIRDRVPDAVLVFIAPPSREELERRLRERGTEDPAELAERLRVAFDEELSQQSWFHHVVVNDDLERAADDVLAIIGAHRTKDET
jgi:guanylate kinase